MRNKWKQLLAVILAFSMVLGSFSMSGITAKAEGETPEVNSEVQQVEVQVGQTIEIEVDGEVDYTNYLDSNIAKAAVSDMTVMVKAGTAGGHSDSAVTFNGELKELSNCQYTFVKNEMRIAIEFQQVLVKQRFI